MSKYLIGIVICGLNYQGSSLKTSEAIRPIASSVDRRQTLYLMFAAFGAYFSMYAFRKPITVTEFDGMSFLGTGVELKTAFLIGQIVGYATSKYLGILVCPTLSREARARTLIGFVVFAEVSLVAFALSTSAWRLVAIFLNGLPLGMVWGLVVRYLEGRRSSEFLLAGISVSFIVSSGIVKDLGRWLIEAQGVPEVWMPAMVGALFLLPFVFFVWLLEKSAPPDEGDQAARVPRPRLDGKGRRAFLSRFGPGLLPLLILFLFLTAYRDFRDNYGIEIFREMGYSDLPGIFTRTEYPAALAVLAALALLGLIHENRRGLMAVFGLMFSGLVVLGGGTLLHELGILGGMGWMIVAGIGSYLAYVPVGAVLFDRLTAAGGTPGTAVFGIYIADAVGYSGSVFVQVWKDLGRGGLTRLQFFEAFSMHLAVGGAICLLLSAGLISLALGKKDDRPTVSP